MLQVGKCQADAAYRSVRLGAPRPSRWGGISRERRAGRPWGRGMEKELRGAQA